MQINNFFHILPKTMVQGDIIRLKTTSGSHWNTEAPSPLSENASANFADVFNRALQKVSDQQVDANELATKMVADPKSVQIHSVLIAQEKARMSLTLTKNVIDLAVKTYRELTNLR